MPLLKWVNMLVHMSQILCCHVAWIVELCLICRLLQAKPPRWAVWYFAILYVQVIDPKNLSVDPHLGTTGLRAQQIVTKCKIPDIKK